MEFFFTYYSGIIFFVGQILIEITHFTYLLFDGEWTPKTSLKENSVFFFACISCCSIVVYRMFLILC